MNRKKHLAYLKEIDVHVDFYTGNGIVPQVFDLKKANDNMFVTNCNIRKARNEDEQETYLRANPNRNNNGYILTEYTVFKEVMKDVFEKLAITHFEWKRVDMSFNTMDSKYYRNYTKLNRLLITCIANNYSMAALYLENLGIKKCDREFRGVNSFLMTRRDYIFISGQMKK